MFAGFNRTSPLNLGSCGIETVLRNSVDRMSPNSINEAKGKDTLVYLHYIKNYEIALQNFGFQYLQKKAGFMNRWGWIQISKRNYFKTRFRKIWQLIAFPLRCHLRREWWGSFLERGLVPDFLPRIFHFSIISPFIFLAIFRLGPAKPNNLYEKKCFRVTCTFLLAFIETRGPQVSTPLIGQARFIKKLISSRISDALVASGPQA